MKNPLAEQIYDVFLANDWRWGDDRVPTPEEIGEVISTLTHMLASKDEGATAETGRVLVRKINDHSYDVDVYVNFGSP